MNGKPYSIENLFSMQENIDFKNTTPSYRESLTKILEALYIQKINETNSNYLSQLSFNEILNLPSLVSESIFNAMISEPRDYIKLEEFVEGLTLLFDKNIDFECQEKTNIPKIYVILYKIFCIKKIKETNHNNKNNQLISRECSKTIDFNNLLSNPNETIYNYNFDYVYDIGAFNKLISNILLVFHVNANIFKIDEFLPFCEEIKLLVKKTFTLNNDKNLILNNNSNFSNINFNITSFTNNINNFPNYFTNQNTINLNTFKEKEEEISCSNFNINLNINNNIDTNMNLNMSMHNNVKMNLNLNMNINNISNISKNINSTSYDCSQCKFCMNCSKSKASQQKNFLTLDEFIECMQKNSKLLFILLFLLYSLSPINQKLIYLLMKNPNSKILDDECDFQEEEDEKVENIHSIPDSVKKVNLQEIRTNSRIMSENNSVNDSFDSISNLNINNNIKNLFERNSRANSKNSNSSKLSNSNLIVNNNLNTKNNIYNKEYEEKIPIQESKSIKLTNNINFIESPSNRKIVFDLSEDTDSFSNYNNNLNNNSNSNKSELTNNKYYNKSRTNSQFESSMNLNNYTNKSKFFNTKNLFDKNNSIKNNYNELNNNLGNGSNLNNNIEEIIEDENSKITNINASTDSNFHYNIKNFTRKDSRDSMSGYNSDSYNINEKKKFIKGNVSDYTSDGEIINRKTINNDNNFMNGSKVINNKNSKNVQVNNNQINFNFDDDSSTFSKINCIDKNIQNNSITNSYSYQNNYNHQDNGKIKNNFFTKDCTKKNDNEDIFSYNLKKEKTESEIIVYRKEQTYESSENTNNNIIFDSKFKLSFDKIVEYNKREYHNEKNENTNNFNNLVNEFSRINTKNSLYNDFNEFLFEKNRLNNLNKNKCLSNNLSRSQSSKLLTRNVTNDNYLEKNNFNHLNNFNQNNQITNTIHSPKKNNMNDRFDFEEVFSEFKVMIQKVKISKDFIFDEKKCEKFIYHSKNNKDFSFKNFNFNVENDWIIRSLKEIYNKINENRVSEIKNFNKHLNFLTVFYQYNNNENLDGNCSKNKNTQKLITGNNSKNVNSNTDDNYLIKEKSKYLTKSIADIIDEYFVLFTFRNGFEENFIYNYLQNNKEKFLNKFIRINNNNNISNYLYNNEVFIENDKEYNFDDNNKMISKINKQNNKLSNESANNEYNDQKGIEYKLINSKEKFSNNSNQGFGISNKETNIGLSEKTTNYKYRTNCYDSKDTKLKINSKCNKNYSDENKSKNNQYNNQNINLINKTEEGNSEVISVLDIYESNDFFSVNLKLLINLRNSTIISLEENIINERKFYPLKIKQDDNIYIIFFETDIEREILINYHRDRILNINPIKNYDLHDLISKTKNLEFTKGTHKITKECVEIKKYFKFNIKSEKILKEINSLRDLSMVYKFFIDSKIPKILFFENSEEIFVVYENCENDPIKFLIMNPDLKITKDIYKYSLNIKKMKELKNMLDILSISLSPNSNC